MSKGWEGSLELGNSEKRPCTGGHAGRAFMNWNTHPVLKKNVAENYRIEVNMLNTTYHLTMAELEEGLDTIRQAPRDQGVLKMIVRRPAVDEREVVEEAALSLSDGLVGDTWKMRGSNHTADKSAS